MIEDAFDVPFVTELAQREKQIQQHYRPVIGVHKWFARRPGSLFRSLILSEFDDEDPLHQQYFQGHELSGVTVGDPFMGGGTPLFEANRLGADVVGTDVNPMAYWVVRQELAPLDVQRFEEAVEAVTKRVEEEIGSLYRTECVHCGELVPVKYFLWVKTISCERCQEDIALFSRHVVAKNQRHPDHVLVCPECRALNEFESLDDEESLVCGRCASAVPVEGPAGRGSCDCPHCGVENEYPDGGRDGGPPRHRLYAMEYHCEECYGDHDGRFFKAPNERDFERYAEAERRLEDRYLKFVPDAEIPSGDESDRLHRWGYERYRQLFNDRQLLGLDVLSASIQDVEEKFVREALLTVFSDTLRYQNMLCRYDTYALKIQDIFSVHGFPVGLTQCENSILGVPGRGSGGFRHFVKKYLRAKSYCDTPYEYTFDPKEKIFTDGETIAANFNGRSVNGGNGTAERKTAVLRACSAEDIELEEGELDAVFTDPPYFANVQYAELMDFCYVWLRQHMQSRPEFTEASTRTPRELTVNETEGRGIEHFTKGMSRAYRTFANGLKNGGPFVFTYHHNEVEAYFPITVALLDAGLVCTSTLPSPAEMGASIHISGTTSSTLDTVFVSRSRGRVQAKYFTPTRDALERALRRDLEDLIEGNLEPTKGDAYCLLLGHITRLAIWAVRDEWDPDLPVSEKLERVQSSFHSVYPTPDLSEFSDRILGSVRQTDDLGPLFAGEPDADFRSASDQWIEFEPAVV
jgi:adenine-specific DNA methylase